MALQAAVKEFAPEAAEQVYVGKRGGQKSAAQTEIDDLLVTYCRQVRPPCNPALQSGHAHASSVLAARCCLLRHGASLAFHNAHHNESVALQMLHAATDILKRIHMHSAGQAGGAVEGRVPLSVLPVQQRAACAGRSRVCC